MRRDLRQWADASKVLNAMVILGFAIAIMVSIFSCQEYYIGKTKEELANEMWRTDSLLMRIKWEADSLGLIHD